MATLRLVLDACLGGRHERPLGQICRGFRNDVLRLRIIAAMDDVLRDEWRRHRTRDASAWLRSMYARKLVLDLGDVHDGQLRDAVSACELGAKERRELDKDLHLIEAALRIDRIVVSVDEAARHLVAKASPKVGQLRRVRWVSPEESQAEDLIL